MQHSDFHHSWIVTILGHSLLSLRVCFSSLLVASWVSLTLFHGSWWVQSFLRFLLHTMGRSYRNGILSAIVTTTEIQGWMWQFSHIQPRSDEKKKKPQNNVTYYCSKATQAKLSSCFLTVLVPQRSNVTAGNTSVVSIVQTIKNREL